MSQQLWQADLQESSLEFKVKHMMISKVKGVFQDFKLEVRTNGENFVGAQVEMEVQIASVDTGTEARDNHLRSADFFNAAAYPTMKFVSTKMEPDGSDSFVVEGKLTIKDSTRPITLHMEYGGQMKDAYGKERAGFSLKTKINREDFGLNWHVALANNKAVVGKQVQVTADIQLIKGEVYDHMMDSLKAATRAQQSQLPNLETIRTRLPKIGVFYQPKEAVGGDFYWYELKDEHVMLLLGDSTGHGLEGSLKSMMSMSILNQVAMRVDPCQPQLLLQELHSGILSNSRKTGRPSSMMAMDGALITLKPDNSHMNYMGAGVSLFQLRNGELIEQKADRLSIGSHNATLKGMHLHEIQPKAGDRFFMYSDGYKDQFGGEWGKKLGPKNTRAYLMETVDMPFDQVVPHLQSRWESWRGSVEQMDDVTLIAIEV